MNFNLFTLAFFLNLSFILCSDITNNAPAKPDVLRFPDGKVFDRESLKKSMLYRWRRPDSFSYFCRAILESFYRDNPLVAPLFNYIFSDFPVTMRKFDHENEASWEVLIVSALILFEKKDPVAYRSILEGVVLPIHYYIKKDDLNMIMERIDNDEYMVTVFQNENFKGFTQRYKNIITESSLTDKDKINAIYNLFYHARSASDFRLKKSKYYFAFSTLTLAYSLDMQIEGSDFEEFFTIMAQHAYQKMILTDEGKNLAEIRLAEILPDIYDRNYKDMDLQERINSYVLSEYQNLNLIKIKTPVVPMRLNWYNIIYKTYADFEQAFNEMFHQKRNSCDVFLFEFVERYMPSSKNIKDVEMPIYTYAALKRMAKLYPEYTNGNYKMLLIDQCKELIDKYKTLYGNDLMQQSYNDYIANNQLFDSRNLISSFQFQQRHFINCYNRISIMRFIVNFGYSAQNEIVQARKLITDLVESRNLESANFFYTKFSNNYDRFGQTLAAAIVNTGDLDVLNYFLEKGHFSFFVQIRFLLQEAGSVNGLDSEFCEKLYNLDIDYYKRENAIMNEECRNLVFNMLINQEAYKLIDQVLDVSHENAEHYNSPDDEVRRNFATRAAVRAVSGNLIDKISAYFSQFKDFEAAYQILKEALNLRNFEVIAWFLQAYPEYFNNEAFIKEFVRQAAKDKNVLAFKFIMSRSPKYLVHQSILLVVSELELEPIIEKRDQAKILNNYRSRIISSMFN